MIDKLIVFIRIYNDADHILPIVYRWTEMTTIPVILMLSDEVRRYPLVDVLTGRPGVTAMRDRSVIEWAAAQTQETNFDVPERAARLALDSIVTKGERAVLLFDHRDDGVTRAYCSAARARGFPTVAVPHGEFSHFCYLVTNGLPDVDIRTIRPGRSEALKHFDRVVFSSIGYAAWATYVDDRKKVVLGSARYCSQWIDVLRTLPQPQSTSRLPPLTRRRRVCLILRSQHCAINWTEVGHAIHIVSQFPEVDLLVKLHPRREPDENLGLPGNDDLKLRHPSSRVRYIGEEIETGKLIEWSEIVLSLMSAVTCHALELRRPLLELRHSFAYDSILDHYLPHTQTRSRDALIHWLFRLLADWPREELGLRFYDEDQLAIFRRAEVEAGDGLVLDRYVAFLRDLGQRGEM